MNGDSITKRFVSAFIPLFLVLLAACGPTPAPVVTSVDPTPAPATPTPIPPPAPTATPAQVPTPTIESGQTALIAFVKDGDIQLWEEASGQSRTIFSSGDVIVVSMSDDAQVLAFLRREVISRSELDWYEQSALWAVERDGENPRELVSAGELREFLNAGESDSTNIPQLEWVPGTHRLLLNGWRYIVQAEGESHATPEGLYLVDADTLAGTSLVPAGNNLRFVPSPDGRLVALTSPTDLGFIDIAGSNWRPAVFTYPATGVPGRIIPGGVWAQDASAFLIAAPAESEREFAQNFTIWRVPVDGSPAQSLASITDTAHDSITFSPDGRSVAYFRGDSPATVTFHGYFVASLTPEAGPLAVPKSSYLFWKNLHWSPAGVPYAIHAGSLVPLCPDAAQDAEVCGDRLDLGDQLAEIYWIDETRFLFVTREPYDLYFGRLDGTKTRIAEGVERFAAGTIACQNDSEFGEGGEGLADMSVAPGTLFRRAWSLRNTGTCAWDPSYRLAFQFGEPMSGPHNLFLSEAVPVGGEIELSVKLIAPTTSGTYQGEWQMLDPEGVPFGVRPVAEIVVPDYPVAEFTSEQIVARIPAEFGSIALGEGALWLLSGNSVSRIDLETNQVAATIPVGEFPSALEIGFGAVWAAASGTVYRIDPLNDQAHETIPVAPDFGLNDLAAGAGSLWAGNGSQGLVYRIDPETNEIIATIPVEPGPLQIAATEDAVWIAGITGIKRIDPDTNEVSATIPIDCEVSKLAVDATAVWVPCSSTPALFRIDPLTNRVLARIAVGYHPSGVAIGPDAIWVTSRTVNTLTRINPATNHVTAVYALDEPLFDVIAAQDELFVKSESAIWRIRP